MSFCDSKRGVIKCSKIKLENHDSQHSFGYRSRSGAQRAQRDFAATCQGNSKNISSALNNAPQYFDIRTQ